MKLSERDTKILAFALIVIMSVLFYFVPYKALDLKKSALDTEVLQLNSTYNQLAQDIIKKEEYKAQIEDTKSRLENYDKLLPAGLAQEAIISQITDLESTVGINFPDIVMGTVVTLFTINQEQVVEGQATTSVDPLTVVEGEEAAIKRDLATSTTLTYSQLKALMAYLYKSENLENPRTRMVLNNLQLKSNLETGDLTANFDLSFYGLLNDKRTPESVDLGNFDTSKEDVFIPYPSYGFEYVAPKIITNLQEAYADLFISLDPVIDDKPTVTIGRTNDAIKESYAYAYQTKVAPIEIEFYQDKDVYFYHYKTDTDSYPDSYEKGVAFDPGVVIEVQVISSKRKGAEDESGANATIINKTDMPVNVVYYSEDNKNPRLNIVKIQGDVVIH